MTPKAGWGSWPVAGAPRSRGAPIARAVRLAVPTLLVAGGLAAVVIQLPGAQHRTTRQLLLAGVSLVLLLTVLGTRHATRRRHQPLLIACLATRLGVIAGAMLLGSELLALATLCVSTVVVMRLAPMALVAGFAAAAVGVTAVVAPDAAVPFAFLALIAFAVGYFIRRDRERKEDTRSLLRQERAARAAEQESQAARAESAALAERARIARDIHDVLANSLSAQLVHLEAARLLVDRLPGSAKVREHVLTARRMAENGLAEVREAVLALRGEQVPLTQGLRSLAADHGAGFRADGEPRPLAVEQALAARRIATEAMTNVRKHAPHHDAEISLEYLPSSVRVTVCDRDRHHDRGSAIPGRLVIDGSGYGIRGMRERAELIDGTLRAEPTGSGFQVLLEFPA